MHAQWMLGLGVLLAASGATASPPIHFRASALVFPDPILGLPPTTVSLDYSFADDPPIETSSDSATYETLASGAMTAELAPGTDASSFSCDGVAIEVVNDGPAGDDYTARGEDCTVGDPPEAVDQFSVEIADASGALFTSTALPLEPPTVAGGLATLVARWGSNSVTLPVVSLERVPEPEGAELTAILALGACIGRRRALRDRRSG